MAFEIDNSSGRSAISR